MGTMFNKLPEDGLAAERMLLRMVTDAYSLTPSWRGDGGERRMIERDIRRVPEPAALGLSEEFSYWEPITARAGVVWQVDSYGFITVQY